MNIIKQDIKVKTPKLNAKWTVELQESTETNISKEAMNDLSKMIQEEIDWEIICDMLKILGYTKVEMNWSDRIDEVQAHTIKEWCRSNLKEHYQGRGKDWLFKSKEDATLFVLKWS